MIHRQTKAWNTKAPRTKDEGGKERGTGGKAAYVVHERVDGALLRQRAKLRSSAHGRVQPRQKRPCQTAAGCRDTRGGGAAHGGAPPCLAPRGAPQSGTRPTAPACKADGMIPPELADSHMDAQTRAGRARGGADRRHHGSGSTSVIACRSASCERAARLLRQRLGVAALLCTTAVRRACCEYSEGPLVLQILGGSGPVPKGLLLTGRFRLVLRPPLPTRGQAELGHVGYSARDEQSRTVRCGAVRHCNRKPWTVGTLQ
jgi:hypothetical protein